MLTYDPEYRRVLLGETELYDEEISYPDVRSWHVWESRLERCTFLDLKAANFVFGGGTEPTRYIDCSFVSSVIRADNPGRATFERCRFIDCVIDRWKCNDVEFIDCELSGELRSVNFHARPRGETSASLGRETNVYRGNDFGSMKFKDTSFLGGVDLLAQRRLPQFADYLLLIDAHLRLPAIIAEIESWPPSHERESILDFLGVQLEWRVERGQHHLLYSPHDWTRGDPQKRAFDRMKDVLLSLGARPTLQQ